MTPRPAPRTACGFSLVEAMVVVSVIAILATLAVPAFGEFIDRQRLKGAAETLQIDLQFARSEAVRRNAFTTVTFATGEGWCYAIGTVANRTAATTCTCATPAHASCIKVVDGGSTARDYAGIRLSSATAFRFEPTTGRTLKADGSNADAPFAATVRSSLSGKAARTSVNLLGIGRLCSPADAALPDYPACS